MEDCCAVCAEPLEWISYGACGHREVCSTCTARLRVVLDEKRCCICKQDCPVVFVTKALGDYTKIVSDLGSLAASHQNGSLWFEADIGAYFDDEDEFKRIKAMCRLQCKICEAAPTLVAGAVRPGHVFRNLDALRRHIFASHKLIMCSLCLEGRKVFIQDQKLYTKPQLDRHSSKGDSIVDGNEEERGGFTGHPMCAFCSRRFYGENELYHHMGTEHFTCHLCQRARAGQFEYYKNYDDLESHFRNEHVLCEDPECLAKKFVVFVSEGELKVHNAKEHGGSLTRAQRNAALKIPVSYQFRRSAAQQSVERGRGSYYRSSRGNDLNAELLSSPPTESLAPLGSDDVNTSAGCSTVASNPEHFPALAPSESVAQSSTSADSARWYSTALHGGSHSSLNESAFPPLPGASQPQQARQTSQRPLASLISAKEKKVKVLNAKQTRPPDKGATGNLNPNEYPELHVGNSSSALAGRGPPLGAPGNGGGSHQSSAVPGLTSSSNSSSNSSSGSVARPSDADVVQLSMDEIRAATKVLIEQIRLHLKGNEEQFTKFKEVHSQFRSGETSAKAYYDQVAKLGLSVILLELVRLCPDRKKQMELLEVMRSADAEQAKNEYSSNSVGSSSRSGGHEGRWRGKQPAEEVVEVLSTEGYRRIGGSGASGISSSSASTLLANGPSVLHKTNGETAELSGWTCEMCTLVNATSSTQCLACGTGKQHQASQGGSANSSSCQAVKEDSKKKKKKVSKFVRNRLGDVDEDASISSSSAIPAAADPAIEVPAAAGTRGAWRNGGGHRLVAMTSSSRAG